MYLIAFTQATQDGNCIFNARLLNHYRLETTLQRTVLFNILTVFVQRSCTNAAQLAACQHRLQDIACIHSTFGSTGTDNGMQLINKHDNLTGAFADSLQYLFQTLFEFTTVFGTGNQSCQVQSIQGFILQAFRYITGNNTSCQTFDDGSFTNARFTDKHRIIFLTTRKDFNRTTDFLITADYRVQLAVFGFSCQILAVFFQRLFSFIICFAILILHKCRLNFFLIYTIFTEERYNIAVTVTGHSRNQLADADFLLTLSQNSHYSGKAGTHHQLTVLTFNSGDFLYQSLSILAESIFINVQALQQIFKEAVAAAQCCQNMCRCQLLVIVHNCLLLSSL